ncbi:unnamed protein product [Toxocara canis]|uniref:DUF7083 domain-containing protein n=1 Tax=Toxocara canis TaxID=6265 RepID=A0A183V0X9_TOXCA|nr:unnamed protein product [Toxocara canis]
MKDSTPYCCEATSNCETGRLCRKITPDCSTDQSCLKVTFNRGNSSNVSRFEEWIQRFEYLFEGAAPSADDKARVKTLMTKLGSSAFSVYRRSCLPKDLTDFTYTETVGRPHELFNKKRSLFADRYACMRI